MRKTIAVLAITASALVGGAGIASATESDAGATNPSTSQTADKDDAALPAGSKELNQVLDVAKKAAEFFTQAGATITKVTGDLTKAYNFVTSSEGNGLSSVFKNLSSGSDQ